MTIRSLFLLLGMCIANAAGAQQYAPGSTDIKTPQGVMRVTSGLVNHLNAHSFHVYTFQYKKSDASSVWNQLPLLDKVAAPPTGFVFRATSTADFPLRDARVVVESGKVALYVAQLKFEDTPYDDSASVELRRYLLKQQPDEERWVLLFDSTRQLPKGVDVEQALAGLEPR